MKNSADQLGIIGRNGTRAEPEKIWKARRIIAESVGDKISLAQIARELKMNPTYLSEKFKQVTGITFVDYVAGTRFVIARILLQDPELRISDIAFGAGFQSLSQFNRVFKRFAGKSPTQYRATLRNGKSPFHGDKSFTEEMRSNFFRGSLKRPHSVDLGPNSVDAR